MRLTAADRVAASPARVFEAVSDIDRITDAVSGPRLSVARADRPAPVSLASRWDAALLLHGTTRSGSAHLVAFEPPSGFRLRGRFDGLDVGLEVSIAGLGAAESRLGLVLALHPLTRSGRVLVGSLELLRPRLSGWMRARLREEARRIEAAQPAARRSGDAG